MGMAAPFSWDPSESWDGYDGLWSTFTLRLGNPAQSLRVLPSTAGQATWAVIDRGCVPSQYTAAHCPQERGGIFTANLSRTWEPKGNWVLGLEANFGLSNISASYGLDTVALGFSNSTGGPVLTNQVVAGFTSNKFYVNTFGLGQQGTNLSNDYYTSFLPALTSKSTIPSRSWSYTAGAHYRSKGVYGSLTLGGYDASRFVPNNVLFYLAGDISRDLVVGLKSITSRNSTGSIATLLPSPILTFIDSSFPYIYLPTAACQMFEEIFGLTWDPSLSMYTISDTLHTSLIISNPNFTFTIADSTTEAATVDIVLPYASFNLQANFPLVPNNTWYFPLKRAANESQYTLGRTFLQEAYLITNYENSTFSLSQCRFDQGVEKNIVPINAKNLDSTASPSATNLPTSSSHLNLRSILGITAGIVIFLILITLMTTCILRKRQSARRREHDKGTPDPTTPLGEVKTQRDLPLREIDENSLCGIREAPDNGKAELQAPRSLKELPDTGKAELRDAISTKSLEFPPQELPSLDHAWLSELMPSDKKAAPTAKSKFALTVSTEYRHGHKTRRSELGISHHSSRGTRIFRRAPNLDRSLPPTPISESPQVSAAVSGAEAKMIEDILLFYYRSRRSSYRSGRASWRSKRGSWRSEKV